MESNCTNCGAVITQNFCANCGQKKFKRIDKKYLFDELQYTVLHTNKGFLYSVKRLIQNPGKTARTFVDGNRVNHYKPILLVFVLSGISAFISFKLIGFNHIMESYYEQQKLASPMMKDFSTIWSTYNSLIMLMLIPLFSVFTILFFRKWGHNFYEHVVMNAYILAFYTICSIVLVYPVLYLVKDNTATFFTITSYSILILPAAMSWFYKGFYPEKKWWPIIGRVLLVNVSILLVYLIFVIVIGIVIAIKLGPEGMKYLTPQ